MKLDLQGRLLQRELACPSGYSKIRGIYGDSQFVDDLDIVNELDGHDGCVNALSWSRSGGLLASGSDDKTVNLFSYLPDSPPSQFALAATIDTGHNRNIFSVKFMPHSNDRTIVTAAGDSEVRVFDIERSVQSNTLGAFLSPQSTNAKVFQSHSSSVKRIVTEASPFYFLTCSEDGDVRQWDVRQPESAYPRSRPRFRRAGGRDNRQETAPPPLISYAGYNIELYSISCSSSQPHYIALGGTHLHCFLHDRRMMGRNLIEERGGRPPQSLSAESSLGTLEEATRCVAKFAPYGQPKMSRNDSKQITACKLSEANPNELIVSWTGDNIYKFDILRDQHSSAPTAYSTDSRKSQTASGRSKRSKKRKRAHGGSVSPSTGRTSRTRTADSAEERAAGQELSLLMQLGNGESFEVPIASGHVPYGILGSGQPSRRDEADSGVEYAQTIRTLKNVLGRSHYAHGPEARQGEMIKILLASSEAFTMIDEYLSQRTFPLTNSTPTIDYELKLRGDRQKTWRFAQASGTLSRVLLRFRQQPVPISRARGVDITHFDIIRPAPREASQPLERHEQFGYDFIKTVLLWLDSGVGAVLREFSKDADVRVSTSPKRFPVSRDAGVDAIDTELIPYLKGLATDLPVVYSGHGGPGDDPRDTDTIFVSEKAAVTALSAAMKTPFTDLSGAPSTEGNFDEGPVHATMHFSDRETALRFWGSKVCMAVLNNAAIDVNFPFVSTAFGDIKMTLPHRSRAPIPASSQTNPEDYDAGELDDHDSDSETADRDGESSDSDSSDEEEESSGPVTRMKYTAGKKVQCSSHVRQYRGHCNVETTKDVNFYGLQDEYIVSGSDCGNFFIWEKKTGKLLNILQGDKEVVNVIQPHPYEPMLAVSGIDSTVKIFSADARARNDAALGIGVKAADDSHFSSIGLRHDEEDTASRPSSGRANGQRDTSQDEGHDDDDYDSDIEVVAEDGLPSRKRMGQEYHITSQNDMNRRTGMHSTYISRGVMQLLAARLSAQMGGEEIEDGLEDNCRMM